jgi:hypothetical protein
MHTGGSGTALSTVKDVISDPGDPEKHGAGNTQHDRNHPTPARGMGFLPGEQVISDQQGKHDEQSVPTAEASSDSMPPL